jgi:two-component system sensor kinase FixL
MVNGTLNTTANSAGEGSNVPPAAWWNAVLYAASLGLVVSAFALRSLLVPTLGNDAPYLLLVPPVLLASVFGGIGPGAFATVLGLGLHLYSTGEVSNIARAESPLFAPELWRAAIFAAIGLASAWFGERLQRTRQEAAAREAHLRSILDTVPEAMIVIDERSVMQSFSSASERLFGYSAAEVICQDDDAGPLSRESGRLPGTLSAHRRAADHRDWARRRW